MIVNGGHMGLDKELLTESFEAIKPVAMQVADKFYEVLFTKYPAAKGLFSIDRLPRQKQALVGALAEVFSNLDRTDYLVSYLTDMGRRHVKYGAQSEHYDWVADSMIETLKYFFSSSWSERLESAWMAALGFIGETMKAGAAQAQADSTAPPQALPQNAAAIAREIRAKIETALREAMQNTVRKLIDDADIRKTAQEMAHGLLHEAIRKELSELSGELQRKDAA